MQMKPLSLIAWGLVALSSCATPLGAPRAPTHYANPVLDADFPDPAVIKAPDGFYYAYATQTEIGGKWVNIQRGAGPGAAAPPPGSSPGRRAGPARGRAPRRSRTVQ
jgi:hypothetical protein